MTNDTKRFANFAEWAELLDYVAAGHTLYYQAPMDARPALVQAVVRRVDGKLRVTPVYTDADPFTADLAHLSRFRRVDYNARYAS